MWTESHNNVITGLYEIIYTIHYFISCFYCLPDYVLTLIRRLYLTTSQLFQSLAIVTKQTKYPIGLNYSFIH